MPDFSTILQDPTIRQVVQENILERAFHDALFPRLLFRGEATPVQWPANVGDSMLFSAPGLVRPKQRPLQPGIDPTPSSYTVEQWSAQIQQYADSIDTHMPTSVAAIASLFLRNAHQLGLGAAQTLNRIVRNKLYNSALSGWTVADGAHVAQTVIRVKSLNGFTKARRPDLVNGEPVRFVPVSTSTPLRAFFWDGATFLERAVTAVTPDNAGDEVGPGTLTISVAVTVADRAPIYAFDASKLIRVGGGNSVDALAAVDTFTLANIREAVAYFWQQNVPEQPDGRFHCHMDPTSQTQIFADQEFQRLLTSLPDYFVYRQFALGEMLGCVFFRNSECPISETVDGNGTFTLDDPFAGELTNATSVKVHRPIFLGADGIFEYYQELGQLITEAGITGKVGEPRITNNGIEIFADRIQLIIRAPLNRLQDTVSTSWKFIGDWPVRTDAATGGNARYKRVLVVEHGE